MDPNMMDPNTMRNLMSSLSGMSDDQLAAMMSNFGVNMDPKLIRQFTEQMKEAKDEDFDKLKEQYQVLYID